MKGIIGKKIGMTSLFDEAGHSQPCTVIEAGPCVVTQVKETATDGYNAVQLSFAERKEKHTPRPLAGHFKKAGTTPKLKVAEFRDFDIPRKQGETVTVDIFEEGDKVNVIGAAKGRGFQGVVKRHNFSGVGSRSHGQHDRERAPGSVGASSYPSKVVKGLKMAGRKGNNRVKIKNLRVLKTYPDKNLILISGNVAGSIGSFVIIEK